MSGTSNTQSKVHWQRLLHQWRNTLSRLTKNSLEGDASSHSPDETAQSATDVEEMAAQARQEEERAKALEKLETDARATLLEESHLRFTNQLKRLRNSKTSMRLDPDLEETLLSTLWGRLDDIIKTTAAKSVIQCVPLATARYHSMIKDDYTVIEELRDPSLWRVNLELFDTTSINIRTQKSTTTRSIKVTSTIRGHPSWIARRSFLMTEYVIPVGFLASEPPTGDGGDHSVSSGLEPSTVTGTSTGATGHWDGRSVGSKLTKGLGRLLHSL